MKNLTHEIPTGKQSILLVKDIAPSGTNRTITDEQLAEMTESVRTHGVIQPLVVRPVACVIDERLRKAAGLASHVLVAGERRWRSARTVGLEKVQVVIRELSDREALELQAIENLQRKDLTDIEEARQYRRLLDCGMKAEELASRVSKSRAHVYNCLKLLELPKDAQDALNSGKLDRAVPLLIARITHPDARKEATRQILAGRSIYNHQTQKQENVPLTFREAKQFIIQNFMLQLASAPFDLQQADLVEGVPSCVNCPKRAGNIKDLFPDLSVKNRNDVCTDPKCFAAKKEAVWQRVKVEAEAGGATVLDEKASKKALPYDNGHVEASSGYIALTQCCVHDPKRRTWEQVLGRKAPALVFARTGDGKVHRLVDAKAALEVVRDMGLKTEERPLGNTMQDADRAAREASLIRRTVQERAVTVVLDKLTKHKNCTDKSLQLALSWLAQDAGFETKKAILRGRGLDPKEAHTAFGEFMAGVKPADHAALALELALWSAYYSCFHGASKLLTETSEVLRVDLPALEKTVKMSGSSSGKRNRPRPRSGRRNNPCLLEGRFAARLSHSIPTHVQQKLVMKTIHQIQSEIQKLRDIRPRVPKITAFNQDNLAAIDIQIEALTAVSNIANLDELKFLPEADQFLGNDFDDKPWYLREAAQEAVDWASDYSDTVSLVDSDGWSSIAK